MEANARSKNAIVMHHIVQIVSPVAIIIICAAAPRRFPLLLMALIPAIVPTVLFVILWTASDCNFQDLHAILVHFNPLLSSLWFFVYFPFCILCSLTMEEKLITLAAIITGLLSLSSAMFATYGIWKSARNVALSARATKREHDNADRSKKN